MKKIYNYLFPVFLSLFALAACDEDNEEIVPMSYTDPVATVTKIDPVEGYVGFHQLLTKPYPMDLLHQG